MIGINESFIIKIIVFFIIGGINLVIKWLKILVNFNIIIIIVFIKLVFKIVF